MARVFIPQEPRVRNDRNEWVPMFDLNPARTMGELVTLQPAGPLPIAPQQIIRDLRNKLKDFCDEDFILPVGNPALIAMVGAVAADVNMGNIQLMYWDPREKKYYVIKVNTRR